MKNHGLKNRVVFANDFTAQRNEKGKWTASESFSCPEDKVTNYIPNKGAACQKNGWKWLGVSGVKVMEPHGGIVQVVVEYGGFPEAGDTTYDGRGADEFTNELSITTVEEPLETHYNYHDVSDEEKGIIAKIKSGAVERDGTGYTFKDADGNSFELTSEKGKELADFIMKGVESYLRPEQIWRESIVEKKMPNGATFNKVGTIQSPKGAPTIGSDRNFLFAGCTVQQTGKKVFNVSYEYILSGKGGWDEKIYGA